MTTTIMNISKTCAAKALNKIDMSVGYVGGDVNMEGKVTQKAEADMKCEQSNDLQAAIRSEMANTIKQSAMTTDNNIFTGDLGIFSNTVVNNYTMNKTIISSDLKDVMNCMVDATNEFKIHFGAVAGDFNFKTTIDQEAKARISSCIQSTNYAQDISNKFTNVVDQEAKAVGTIVGLAAEAGDIMTKTMTAVIICAVMGALVYFTIKFTKKKKKVGGKIPASGTVNSPALAQALTQALGGATTTVSDV